MHGSSYLHWQLSAGIIFGPSIGVLGHWFKYRRGLALGLQACGSSIGGTVFPIIVSKLIPQVGCVRGLYLLTENSIPMPYRFPWTMRIIGFILIVTCTISNVFVRRRLPPRHTKGGLLNLTAFKQASFTIYVISSFVGFLGLYTG